MSLTEAIEEKEYIIKDINTDDEELNSFLFSLGCYSGKTTIYNALTGKNERVGNRAGVAVDKRLSSIKKKYYK